MLEIIPDGGYYKLFGVRDTEKVVDAIGHQHQLIATFQTRADAELFVRAKAAFARGNILCEHEPGAPVSGSTEWSSTEWSAQTPSRIVGIIVEGNPLLPHGGHGDAMSPQVGATNLTQTNRVDLGCRCPQCDVVMEKARQMGMTNTVVGQILTQEIADEYCAKPDVVIEPDLLIWNDRAVKVKDGLYWLSVKGQFDLWDVAPPSLFPEMAMCGSVGYGRVREVAPMAHKNMLKITCEGGVYVLVDKVGKSGVGDFKIEEYDPKRHESSVDKSSVDKG